MNCSSIATRGIQGPLALLVLSGSFLANVGTFPGGSSGLQAQELMLPDIILRRSDLSDQQIRTVGGRTELRISNGTANVGHGPLYVYGAGAEGGAQDEPIRQRIFRDDDSFIERDAGNFVYHPGHNHIHIEDWAQFRIREITSGDGVGDIIAEGNKTSFCILDLGVYDRNIPGFDARGQFRSCSSRIQGLSVGWIDVYDKSLEGQSIDITDVPDGHYWLEAVVDPENHFTELNEDNNVERLRITIGNPSNFVQDRYEPNDDVPTVQTLREGGPNSSNLGPVNPKVIIEDLSIHTQTDEDFFSFYANSVGGPVDFVRIDFDNSDGNLDIELLDESGNSIEVSETTEDVERISLEGRPEGRYWVRVHGRDGARNAEYRLTVNPPSNQAPSLELLTPEAGETRIRHGLDLFLVNWTVSDPEENPTWVSVYVVEDDGNGPPSSPEDGELVPTTLHTPGDLGFVVLNTAEIPPGTYWIYGEATDGGTTIGGWAPGRLSLIELNDKCVVLNGGIDCNANNILDSCDIEFGSSLDCNENGAPDECEIANDSALDSDENGVLDSCEEPTRPLFHRGDANGDSALDLSDSVNILDFLFVGASGFDCVEAADVNNDATIDITDVIIGLNFLFLGTGAPAEPGPPGLGPCGPDPDAAESAGDLGCVTYEGC